MAWWQKNGHPLSSQVLEQYRGAGRTALFTCPRCGFGLFDPPITGSDEFYQEISEAAKGGYYSRDTWEHRQALAALQDSRKVLEIGCGAGFFLEKLQSRGKEVQGLELNSAAADFARSRGVPVAKAALEEFAPGHQEEFDTVCFFQVLEHVAQPLVFFDRALSCLRPRGRLFVSVPNMAGILGKMAPLVSNIPPHHVSRWTPEALAQLARRFGLVVAAWGYEPAYNLLPAWFQERLKARGVPAWVYQNRIWRFFQSLPVKLLRTFKPKGLQTLPGHTVYAMMIKK
ncbi:MAG: class I SAM-dependent methyltransferase [Thermodesulfobacteriota bacterium]